MTSAEEVIGDRRDDDVNGFKEKKNENVTISSAPQTPPHCYLIQIEARTLTLTSQPNSTTASNNDNSPLFRSHPYNNCVGDGNEVINILCQPHCQTTDVNNPSRDINMAFAAFGLKEEGVEHGQKIKHHLFIQIGQKRNEFPVVLQKALSLSGRDGVFDISDSIAWLHRSQTFIVRDKKRFLRNIASLYFRFPSYESFIHQINNWGFKYMTQSPNIDSYYHELFLRGIPMPHLTKWMNRSSYSFSDEGKQPRSQPWNEPNLFSEISLKYFIRDNHKRNKEQRQTTEGSHRSIRGRNPQRRDRSISSRNLRRRGGYFEDAGHKRNKNDSQRVIPVDGFILGSSKKQNDFFTPSAGVIEHHKEKDSDDGMVTIYSQASHRRFPYT